MPLNRSTARVTREVRSHEKINNYKFTDVRVRKLVGCKKQHENVSGHTCSVRQPKK